MKWQERYIYEHLNVREAYAVTPGMLGPCHGTNCPTCGHFDELIGGLTATSEAKKPSTHDRSRAKKLKEMKARHKKARV